MKKILAIAIALVMAMALSVTAFAAETGTYTTTITSADEWWHEVMFSEFLDFDKVAEYDTLTIAVDGVNLVFGYNSADGSWAQTDPAPSPITLNVADCKFDEYAKVAVCAAAGDYTITWTLSKADEAVEAPADDTAAEAPADDTPAETPAETPADAPATGLALAVIPAVVAMAAAVVSKKH